jgi:hypothetical protein
MSAANELHQLANALRNQLAEPEATQVLSRQEVTARQSFVEDWETIQAQASQ